MREIPVVIYREERLWVAQAWASMCRPSGSRPKRLGRLSGRRSTLLRGRGRGGGAAGPRCVNRQRRCL